MKFPIVKLLDYETKWNELEQSTNPFAMVVMAHLKAVATHGKTMDRLHWKKALVKRMYEQGYSGQEVIDLFRFIDWIMKLPEVLEQEIQVIVDEFEEAKQMKYVTSIERLAAKQARREGLQEGTKEGRRQAQRETILRILQFRFQPGEEMLAVLAAQLDKVEDESTLQRLIDSALEVATFADLSLPTQ